jgi:chromosome segregation ATPase
VSDPNRYNIAANQAQRTLGGNILVVDPNGQLVAYEDYARLSAELTDLKSTADRFKAEVERLEGNIFGWKGVVMGQDSRLKCRDEEIELLKADLERRTEQYNSIIDQQLDTISDLKSKVEHIDLYKSVVEKFFNSADLKNQPDAQSHYAIMEKLKQLPDCILDFTEEQVRDNPAWALAVFRHKVKDMQYKRVHDLNAIGGEHEENARLKAEVDELTKDADEADREYEKLQVEVERLRKAGEWQPMGTELFDSHKRIIICAFNGEIEIIYSSDLCYYPESQYPRCWMPLPPAAKDGKPSE